MSDRDLDVVVFGATGITGRGVAAYLAERNAETGARWAAAGRDPAKLERVLREAGVNAAETIVADVSDPASLAAMASRTRVVLNLVGPYTLHGRPVIEACVATRPPWSRTWRSPRRCGAAARSRCHPAEASGAR